RVRLPQVVPSPQVISDGRAFGAGGGSSFRAAIDPANTGVRITRLYDPEIGHQRARLVVDGTTVGMWDSGNPVPAGSWAVQAIDVPAAATAGKSSIVVQNLFDSSDYDVNEFRYDVHSQVRGDWVRTDVMDTGPGHDGEGTAHGYGINLQ